MLPDLRRPSSPGPWRRFSLPAWDGAAWIGGLVAGTWLRYEGDFAAVDVQALAVASALAVIVVMSLGALTRTYRGRYYEVGIDDVINLALIMAGTGLIIFVLGLTQIVQIPRSVPITATLVALSVSLSLRLALRLNRERRARPNPNSAHRVIIFGAGVGGRQIVRSMLSDAESGYLPVALLDDDRALQSRRVSGVGVLGTHEDIADVARRTEANMLVVAIRDVDAEVMQEVNRATTEVGLRVRVLPPLTELFRPWVAFSDLRDLNITDLLGRRPVNVDVSQIAGYLTCKRVLVTGAGGSIGSELCRQLHQYGPTELMMLDRDESALHALQLSIYGEARLDSPDVILADIRDPSAIAAIFAERRPEVVFHAAALKHLTMLEQYPHEAWKSNIVGTLNILQAAEYVGVGKFVNISTDKAANPSSVLGRSKRISERLVAHAAARATGTFLSVRFGNVLGSRGSVLSTFAQQLANDEPLTVTHPDVTRFFMTIPEAVRLVIQAAAIGRPGEALVLDMGSPVRIADVARHLITIAGKSAQIVYTGLREGEKLHEELFGHGEADYRPMHPEVSHVAVTRLDPDTVLAAMKGRSAAEAMTELLREPPTAQKPRPFLEADRLMLDCELVEASQVDPRPTGHLMTKDQ